MNEDAAEVVGMAHNLRIGARPRGAGEDSGRESFRRLVRSIRRKRYCDRPGGAVGAERPRVFLDMNFF